MRLSLLLLLACGLRPALAGLSLSLYNNTACAGAAASASVVPGLSFSAAASASPMSASLTGTLHAAKGAQYTFTCDFGRGARFATLHIDDHLVCQLGAHSGTGCGPPGTPQSCAGVDNPLPTMTRTALPVRMTVLGTAGEAFNVTVDVAVSSAAAETLSFEPALPALEQQRLEMQRALRSGWGAFYAMSYLDHVLLPQAARVTLALCEIGGGKCLTEGRIDWTEKEGLQATVRPGIHAYDRSYAQLHVAVGGCNVSVVSSGGDKLRVAVEVVGGDPSTCAGYALVPIARTTWLRDNTPSVDGSALAFSSRGNLPDARVFSSRPSNGSILVNVTDAHLAFALDQGSVALTSGTAPEPLADTLAALAAARKAEEARYLPFGALAQTKAAVQAAVMWQVVWNPLETGPFAPVIRGNPWGLDKGTTSDDWLYVLFDWDNFFGSYMLSLDAKELGYSALITVLKAKTKQGFVANTAAAVNKARHSQPPVGGKVLLEMFRKYNETWIVDLLLDDLIDWNDWFVANRTLSPLNITCLGSAEGDMQDARFESGLDNSPMYDDGPCRNGTTQCGGWNCTGVGKCGSFEDDKMQLYDVGMASMHAMDSAALAQLATAVGRHSDAAMLQARADTMAGRIEAHLWDEQSGIYVNRLPTGEFNRRISPTSFYALQTGVPSDDRVESLVQNWLLNKDRFCVAPTGDSAGNADTCYWGLPSISADDAAFPKLGYWRGYVWGPMAQLTFWGLQEYDHVPKARTARKALCSQMNAMMLEQWRNQGYICENFYPAKNHVGCSPGAMHFYHWGALAGFISLLDEGFY